MQLFGARGVPQRYDGIFSLRFMCLYYLTSLRYVNGFGNHTFKFGKPDGSFVYTKIHFKVRMTSCIRLHHS
jgi:catalase